VQRSWRLLPQIQFLEQVFIPVGFRLAQIIEQAPALGDHFQEAAARRVIFGIVLEVFGQLRDPAGEQRDLHVCAPGILLVELELLHVDRVTAFCHKRAGIVGEEHALARAVFRQGQHAFRSLGAEIHSAPSYIRPAD
jgi:hypothetical protein